MELFKRMIVGIIGIPLLLWIYYSGGAILYCFLGIISFLCSFELNNLILKLKKQTIVIVSLYAVLLFFCIADITFLNGIFPSTVKNEPAITRFFATLFIIMFITPILNIVLGKIKGIVNALSTITFTCLYIAVGFGFLYHLSLINRTIVPILAVLIWTCDTFAYFIGMKFGQHRGVFKVSPNKSLEGFIAGFVFTFFASVVVLYIFPDSYTPKHLVYFTISVGIFGQYGDLFESMIKRDMGIKNSSNLIPGHGGVLDRFDSLLISAPVLFILMSLF